MTSLGVVLNFLRRMRVGMLGAGFSLAVAAGFFAAMASVFSKLAFEDGGSTLKYITCPFLAENVCTNVSNVASHTQQANYSWCVLKLIQCSSFIVCCVLLFSITGCVVFEIWVFLDALVEQCIHVDTLCEGITRLYINSRSSSSQ